MEVQVKRAVHYSPATRRAVTTLGKLIAAERRTQGRPQADLAERAGISIPTLNRIETGAPGTAIGTFFELAVILGIPLFPDVNDENLEQRLALVPSRVRRRARTGSNDF